MTHGRRSLRKKVLARSAEGALAFCVKHGGGKHRRYVENGEPCARRARGATPFCKKHGSGKRCRHVETRHPAVESAASMWRMASPAHAALLDIS